MAPLSFNYNINAMQKKVYKIIINTMIFIVFSYSMAGITIAHGFFGRVIIGIGYALVFNLINTILRFFKLPDTKVLKAVTGLVLVTGYLYAIANLFASFITITKGYLGSIDFILFFLPRIVSLDSQLAVIIASSIILLLCSIIIEKLKK